mmetsp:Transcript_38727/g.60518  ORF Transcript_38727/g.60518 Transcript_38727/m.60518 type:complete len:108 (-) Transcript_38727:234-557(-)
MENYISRNYTTHLADTTTVWDFAPSYVAERQSFSFNLTAVLQIPIEQVSYTPDISEVLKDAWIQYLSMAVVVGFLLQRLSSFVCYYQIVETDMRVETSTSRKGVKMY